MTNFCVVKLSFRAIFPPLCSSEIQKKYSQSDVHLQNHFTVQFPCVFAPKASSVTNKQGFTVFAEFRLAGISARSPVTLPVLALALSASRHLLTVYSSSHLVRPVWWRLCAYEACSALEAALSFPISDLGADGAGSSSLLIWMLHASAS